MFRIPSDEGDRVVEVWKRRKEATDGLLLMRSTLVTSAGHN